jgi:zinc transport system ATP-binding protein
MSDVKVIQLEDVGVQYPNGVQALSHISLEISKNDFVGMIGPNGAGKSTLIGVTIGLIKPTSGVAKLFGEPVSTGNLRRVSYVPQMLQSTAIGFPGTVFETVLFGRVARTGLFHRLNKVDRTKAEQALEHVEISDLRNRQLSQLSGGQLQRVLVAKALAAESEILILDEPTSGADIHSKTEFYTFLGHLNEAHGITIILSSHDIGVVTKLARTVVCINRTLFYCGLTSEFPPDALAKTYDYSIEVMQHAHA